MAERLTVNVKDLKKEYSYYGYKVYPETGRITTKNGRELSIKGSEQVYLTIGGKRKSIKRARVVYEVATGEKTDASDVFVYKDGNKLNAAFSNIDVIKRKDYFRVKGVIMNASVSKEDVDEIRRIYDRKKKKKLGRKSGCPTYTELAKKYNCSKSTVLKILNGEYVYDKQKNKGSCAHFEHSLAP